MFYELFYKANEYTKSHSDTFYKNTNQSEIILIEWLSNLSSFIPIKSAQLWIAENLNNEIRVQIVQYSNILLLIIFVLILIVYIYLHFIIPNSVQKHFFWLSITNLIYKFSIFILTLVFFVYTTICERSDSFISINFSIRVSMLIIFIFISVLIFNIHKLGYKRGIISGRSLKRQNFFYSLGFYSSLLMFRINVLNFFIWILLINWCRQTNDEAKKRIKKKIKLIEKSMPSN
jgi:hypothetical protein